MWLFYFFHIERNYNVLKTKSLCFLLNNNINFNKNETELKMENHTHIVLEERLERKGWKLEVWKLEVCTFLSSYRNYRHTTTNITPSNLMFNRKVRDRVMIKQRKLNKLAPIFYKQPHN